MNSLQSKYKVVLFLIHTSSGRGGGITTYCNALYDLFYNSNRFDVSIYPFFPTATPLGNKYDINKLKEFVDKEKPDLLHINGYTSLIVSQIVPFANKNGLKVVYTPHWHPFYTMRLSKLKQIHFGLFVKPYLKYIKGIVCINKEESTFFKKISGTYVDLIPHWYKKIPSNDSQVKRVTNRILFIGNLFYGNKGFDFLYNLPEGKYDIHCVGRGVRQLRSDMTQHIDISESELSDLFYSSSLVVIPSRYEAFSYVALEALTHGTPVLVSDNVRISDYISNLAACNIYRYGDKENFITKVSETIGNKFVVAEVISPFSKEKALKSYTDFYLRALSQ